MFKPQVLLRFFIAFCVLWVPLQSFDLWLYDHLFRLKPRPQSSPHIVLITLSPGKLQQNLSQSDASVEIWYSDLYSNLIQRLSQAHPQLIIFSQRYDRIVGAVTPFESSVPILFSSQIDSEGKVLPPPGFLAQSKFGFNNLFLDSDNVFRSTPLTFSSEKSLAVMAYEILKRVPYKPDLTTSSRIYFNGPQNTFISIDVFDYLNSAAFQDQLKDKIIFIGKDSSSLSDVNTPMGEMSGLEVQANILSTLLNQRSVISLLSPWTHLITLVSFALTLFLIFYFPLSIGSALLFLWSIFLGIVAYGSLIWLHTWIGLANPLFAILSTHLLFIGYKIKQEEEKQRKIQEESRLLKEIDEFKNNFISLFSHDLKTPIAKIKAIVDRMSNEQAFSKNPNITEGLQAIEKANQELSRLISDILRVTKMESMILEPAREVIDLNRLVESAVQRLKILAEEKQLNIIQNLEPLFTMEGDSHLLLEVITNLLENAIKYSPAQSRIIIQTRESENQMSVHIFDEGPGISEDELPKVTTKFFRGKTAGTTTKGTGLGLYLAKYFVELHRGTLTIQSKKGVGTHVSFSLPIG